MEKKIVTVPGAPAPLGPYSPAVEIGNLVYTSGQLGTDAAGNLGADVKEQTRLSLTNVKNLLNAAGCDMCDIVKSLVFIKDMNDFAAVNEVYAELMTGDVMPARSCVEVARLPKDALVEIEVIALKK
ncbi:MAG: RidA family protein [Clostridia bacterium]|nr:RidA family protein [Oscillospiraceae bacterium]MBQ2911486.1 RidA family protein [Clostridia bacterium]MBQ6836624.1 RidA family protein [Clostridia bacterium]MBQ6932882.1 RidA family protein [Clostridia bacterium]MBQ7086002.1 RidA family protein [Clostridia bacterium]